MTPQMHAGLHALIVRFYREDITEEEWALLQVHIAYCNSCEREFAKRKEKVVAEKLEGAARDGERSNAAFDLAE
jgi:hypothetical protein